MREAACLPRTRRCLGTSAAGSDDRTRPSYACGSRTSGRHRPSSPRSISRCARVSAPRAARAGSPCRWLRGTPDSSRQAERAVTPTPSQSGVMPVPNGTTYVAVRDWRERRLALARPTAYQEGLRVLEPLRVGQERVQRPEVPTFRFRARCAAVPARIQSCGTTSKSARDTTVRKLMTRTEALRKPCTVRALDGLAQPLNWREDLLRQVVFVVCSGILGTIDDVSQEDADQSSGRCLPA